MFEAQKGAVHRILPVFFAASMTKHCCYFVEWHVGGAMFQDKRGISWIEVPEALRMLDGRRKER